MLTLIALIIFTVINLTIYHKFFHVIYFDLGRGLLKEVLTAFFIAMFELAILMIIGPYILIAAAIIVVLVLIVRKVKSIQENSDSSESSVNNDEMTEESVNNSSSQTNNQEEQQENNSTIEVESTEQNIENTIQDTEVVEQNPIATVIKPDLAPDTNQQEDFEDDNLEYCEKEDVKNNHKDLVTESTSQVHSDKELGINEKTAISVSDKMFCSYCGKRIDRSAKFCIFCGKRNKYILGE